jgi:hypothetical protein
MLKAFWSVPVMVTGPDLLVGSGVGGEGEDPTKRMYTYTTVGTKGGKR